MLLFLLSACPSPEPAPIAPTPESPVPNRRPDKRVMMSSDRPEEVSLEVRFFALSSLYQGFFADEEALRPLKRALGVCVRRSASVSISYDSERRIGRIVLVIPLENSRCSPKWTGQTLSLDEMRPLGLAMAAYRDRVANLFDLRVFSFRTSVEFTSEHGRCGFELKGSHPPDGRTWSSCVAVDGRLWCSADGQATQRIGPIPSGGSEALRRCFSTR